MERIRRLLLVGVIALTSPAATADEAPATCGGIVPLTCSSGQFCDFPDGHCGAADRTGTCMPIPFACTREYQPVCGCDGVTYPNDCERRAAGASKLRDGAC